MTLTDLQTRNAKAKGKVYTLGDYDGLALHVSPKGSKAWHLRYYWLGKQSKMSLGTYPELSLRDARALRDEARALIAKGINPRIARKQKRQAARLAGEYTFMAVYERWLAYRALALEEGRQSTLAQMRRVFKRDVIPVLRRMTIHEITRHYLLEVVGRIEKRGSLSVAEKVRTWFRQLFEYAMVVVPGMEHNPARDLHVVAVPLPPVQHNPFLRMEELPSFLRTLRAYQGRQVTQLAARLLLLTGVRTGELRLATPDQFDLKLGLWIIPVVRLKQRRQLAGKKRRKRLSDIPPYVVPLSVQAMELVRHLLEDVTTAQVYLFPGQSCLKRPLSENTLNRALKFLGYEGRLTGHGVRATISTALNELGYPKKWVDAQLSHADPDKISATYNHAEYVEQRRVMMQDWADRLDLFEQNQVEAASTHLTITLQGLPTMAGQARTDMLAVNPEAPRLLVAPPSPAAPMGAAAGNRLSAVNLPEYAWPIIPELQRRRLELLETFEAPHNLTVAHYARLAGKSRRWISYEIRAGHLLALQVGNRGQRVPDWQLDPLKRRLVQTVLKHTTREVDGWCIYDALVRPHPALDGRAPIDAVTAKNLQVVVRAVVEQCQADSIVLHTPPASLPKTQRAQGPCETEPSSTAMQQTQG
ncbi:tyrosine-type recombinase/integrase [Luteimonas sp. RIT-PG2_3]